LIHAAYEIVDADLRQQYGVPMHKTKQGRWVETGFAVMGMGKLGGHELNYSSMSI
jgi:glutamate-ammonia-ligase adenylyltransferase